MADENIVTNIVANADFSGLIADVNKVTASLSKLQAQLIASDAKLANQVAVMNRSFSENLRRTGQFSTHFVTLTSDTEKFGKSLDGGKLKLKDYFRTFQEHTKTSGGIVRDLAKQQVALQNAIIQPLGKNAQGLMQFNVQVPQGLDNIKNKTAIARQELQILNKVVQDGGVQLINWGKNTQWAGRQLTVGLTVPLAAFGKAAADAFRMADAELTRLTKVYGGVAATSSAELSKIRAEVSATAAEISKGYGISFKDTIALAADIAATGKTGNELLSSVKETSRLAVLGEVDRQDAMKATLAIQTTFKQNTEQLSESINFLNSVENQTSTSLADLVEAIPKAGPVMMGLGGNVKDLALYLTAMKEGGINASEGANALKSALASLINPTKVATEKFKGMGIDLGGIVTQNAGNLTGTITALQEALDSLDPLQKQQAIEQLFGKFQFARMNALFSNLGKQGSQTLQVMDLMKASSQDLANVASRELSMVTESASGKYNRAIQGLKADLAGIGEEFLKVQTFFINVVDGIINFTTNLPGPIKQILTFAGGLTAVIGPVIMLTGVLANFFGYVIKGVSHFKALFKGGEGWKMLTPEILAAQKAGSLVEKTFYSDAQAATVLKTAIEGLVAEFTVLQSKAQSGAISVAPALNNFVNGVAGRVVNPNHPMLSPTDTRSMSHMNPVGGMTADQKTGQSIFGVVPGAPRVNQTIGNNPQIYANSDLPDVPGLTRIGKASTGVVATEAAKWHSMTGALAMQSEAEIKALKMEVGRTGLITHELSASYQALLPEMTRLTQQAAAESAAIVAELQASKITIDQARAKIISLNAQIEASMGIAATNIAGQQGRSIALNSVPLLNQPVVDRSGKSNMKELARPGRTRGLLNKIAGGLGVKTFGAPYSIETTMPKKFSEGTVGYRGGYASPMAKLAAAAMLAKFAQRSKLIGGLKTTKRRSARAGAQEGAGISYGTLSKRKSKVYDDPEMQAYGITPTKKGVGQDDEYIVHGYGPGIEKATRGLDRQGSSPVLRKDQYDEYGIQMSASTRKHDALQVVPTTFIKNRKGFNEGLRDGTATAADFRQVTGSDMMSLLLFLKDQKVKPAVAKQIAERAAIVLNEQVRNHRGPMNEASFGKMLNRASVRAIDSSYKPSMVRVTNSLGSDAFARNQGLVQRPFKDGVIKLDGYGGGDSVPALLEPGESVVTKSGTRKNEGALHLMNAGYSVDDMMGFEQGVVGFRAGMKSQTQKGYLGKGMMSRPEGGGMGMGAQMGIMMGGSMLGQQVGGTAGTGIMAAANILPWLPFQKILPLLKAANSGAGAFKTALTLAGKAAGLLTRLMPGAAVIGTLYLLYKGYQKWQKGIEDTRREHIMLNGITEKGAKEAGISYKNIGNSIKDVREQLKLQKEAGMSAYESMTPSGVGGLTLTIAQLKELKKTAKETMPELLGTFNSIDSSSVNDLAANLKAQFVAAGMSAQDATNKIYAIIEASNKAGQGLGAITSSGFTAITDKGSAATAIVKTLLESLKEIDTVDSKAFASNIDTVISSLDSATAALVGTKDAQGKTINASQAMTIQYEKLVKLGATTTQLGEKALENLKKERPELAAILKSTDTVAGMYAKWRVLLAGVNIDLKSITSEQAMGIAAYEQALALAADSSKANTNTTGSLATANAATNKLTTDIKKGEAAVKKYSNTEAGLSKARIKAIQEEIKAIRDRADEKKKALRANVESENTELELQKLKLEAQSALARGDRDAYESANIAIAQLTKETQLKKAEDKIDANAKKEEAIQQAILDKDQAEKDRIAALINATGNSAQSKTEQLAQINGIKDLLAQLAIDKIENNALKDPTKKADGEKVLAGKFQTILETLEKSSNAVQKAFPEYVNSKTNKAIPTSTKIYGLPGGPGTSMSTGAGGAFDKLVSEIAVGAKANFEKLGKDITGGANLKMVVEAMGGKIDKSLKLKTEDVTALIKANQSAYSGDLKNMLKEDGSLKESVRNSIIVEKKLNRGDKFTYNDKVYNVSDGWNSNVGPRAVLGKALGGPVVAGQTYRINDRINALGAQQEGFMPFTPKVSGVVYPNADTMPKYNIASGDVTGMRGGVNSSYNNNSYAINIALNGTNVTADDVMRRFKTEMALVHAKEGRSRSVGGQV